MNHERENEYTNDKNRKQTRKKNKHEKEQNCVYVSLRAHTNLLYVCVCVFAYFNA